MKKYNEYIGLLYSELGKDYKYRIWFPDMKGWYVVANDMLELTQKASFMLTTCIEEMKVNGQDVPAPRGFAAIKDELRSHKRTNLDFKLITIPVLTKKEKAKLNMYSLPLQVVNNSSKEKE